eukprot:4700305-Pyramimonas_sp.AAC.1
MCIDCSRRTSQRRSSSKLEQWASRPTYLGIASHVEPVVPHSAAVDPDKTGCARRPRRPWGP